MIVVVFGGPWRPLVMADVRPSFWNSSMEASAMEFQEKKERVSTQ